jgi:hypothetical protein
VATTEKQIKILQDLLVKIDARRRRSDGSVPAAAAALEEIVEAEASDQEITREDIPTMAEAFEAKPEPPIQPRLTEAPIQLTQEVQEAEEEAGESTDRLQIVPIVPPKIEDTTLPWSQPFPPPETASPPAPADMEFPAVEKEAAPEQAAPLEPSVLKGELPFQAARPFTTSSETKLKVKPTVGQLLLAAFTVGEHRDL